MHFELWDTASGNMLDDFATESEAFAAVTELLAINEADIADSITLLRIGGPNGGDTVASGPQLVRLAQATAAQRGSLPA